MDSERQRRAGSRAARGDGARVPAGPRGHGGPGVSGSRPQPDWQQWQVDPDTLWPGPFPGQSGQSRADRRDTQRHELLQKRARDPGARPRLTREEIVDAAIAIADAEGAEALSMRRIAQVLRSGTMSLYWHVANKEHLVDLMRDMLMAEIDVPEPSGDWQADLRAVATSSRAMFRRHRWLMEFTGGRPPLGPNTVFMLERSLAILAGLKLPPGVAINILTTINTYVTGAVLREVQEMHTQQSEREMDLDPREIEREGAAWRDRLARTGMFPNFVAFIDAQVDPDAAETMEQRFEFGLDSLLAGIAERIAQ